MASYRRNLPLPPAFTFGECVEFGTKATGSTLAAIKPSEIEAAKASLAQPKTALGAPQQTPSRSTRSFLQMTKAAILHIYELLRVCCLGSKYIYFGNNPDGNGTGKPNDPFSDGITLMNYIYDNVGTLGTDICVVVTGDGVGPDGSSTILPIGIDTRTGEYITSSMNIRFVNQCFGFNSPSEKSTAFNEARIPALLIAANPAGDNVIQVSTDGVDVVMTDTILNDPSTPTGMIAAVNLVGAGSGEAVFRGHYQSNIFEAADADLGHAIASAASTITLTPSKSGFDTVTLYTEPTVRPEMAPNRVKVQLRNANNITYCADCAAVKIFQKTDSPAQSGGAHEELGYTQTFGFNEITVSEGRPVSVEGPVNTNPLPLSEVIHQDFSTRPDVIYVQELGDAVPLDVLVSDPWTVFHQQFVRSNTNFSDPTLGYVSHLVSANTIELHENIFSFSGAQNLDGLVEGDGYANHTNLAQYPAAIFGAEVVRIENNQWNGLVIDVDNFIVEPDENFSPILFDANRFGAQDVAYNLVDGVGGYTPAVYSAAHGGRPIRIVYGNNTLKVPGAEVENGIFNNVPLASVAHFWHVDVYRRVSTETQVYSEGTGPDPSDPFGFRVETFYTYEHADNRVYRHFYNLAGPGSLPWTRTLALPADSDTIYQCGGSLLRHVAGIPNGKGIADNHISELVSEGVTPGAVYQNNSLTILDVKSPTGSGGVFRNPGVAEVTIVPRTQGATLAVSEGEPISLTWPNLPDLIINGGMV